MATCGVPDFAGAHPGYEPLGPRNGVPLAGTSAVRPAPLAPAQSCTLKRPCRAPDISRANCAWLT
jgi:hypothetical protein